MAHDYGLKASICEYTTNGKPIRVERPYKNVILVNVGDCKDRITVSHVRERLQGTGKKEWEAALSNWLVKAIVEAIRNGEEEADITKLFSCDLQVDDKFGSFTKPQEMVINFLMGRLFECLEEDDNVMRVRIIEKAIYNQA